MDVTEIAGVPASLAPLFTSAAKTCPQVTPALLAAQAKHESRNFDPDVISGKFINSAHALGIAQFIRPTWDAYGAGGSPFNPADAIPAQARYMCAIAKAVDRFPGDKVNLMLAAYNAGTNAVRHYNGVPPYKETRTYIRNINKDLGR